MRKKRRTQKDEEKKREETKKKQWSSRKNETGLGVVGGREKVERKKDIEE